MAIHDMANQLCDLEADSATKTSSCVHTHLAFWVIHSWCKWGHTLHSFHQLMKDVSNIRA
jgi:hypothetical protein